MAFIARTYVVLTLEELVERMARGALPRNALAITFDDGYRDNLTHAAPILARYGLPATIFVSTGFIGTGDVPWFDRMALAFKTTRADAYRAPWGEQLGLATTEARRASLGRILERMKGLSDDELRSTVERVCLELGVTGESAFKNVMLSWDDVHALGGLGFSVGAHTVTHPILSRVSRARAEAEIRGSRAMIEAACGQEPRAFAYPNGGPADYTEMICGWFVMPASCARSPRGSASIRPRRPGTSSGGADPGRITCPTFALKLAGYRLAEAWMSRGTPCVASSGTWELGTPRS